MVGHGTFLPATVGVTTVWFHSAATTAADAPAPREVADRIEIGDEIGHVLWGELGNRHVLGSHGLQHGRLLVPDRRGELDRAPSCAHGHEIWSHGATGAADFVALHAALLHEETSTHLRSTGQHEERTLRGAAGGRREVRAQITQLLRGHGRTLDALRLHRLGHGDPMIPHGGGQIHGRGELLQGVELGPYRAPHPSDRVAYRALLVDEELAPLGGIPGPVEIPERIEEADEIARLLARELGARDSELLHALGHAGQMVPEGRRHVVEGMRARALAEIRTDLASDAVDRVALLTTLGCEHARARHRILARAERGLRPRAVTGDQREDERDTRHNESDHCGSFLIGIMGAGRHMLSDGRRCYSKALPTTRIQERDRPSSMSTCCYLPRTVSTGQGAAVTTREATLPRKNLANPVRPWVPMTIRSAFFDLAARTICAWANPSSRMTLTLTPDARALSRSVASCFSACLRAEASRSS